MPGSKNGIGVKPLYLLYCGVKDIFWASVVTSAMMGVISYLLIVVAEKVLIPWQKPEGLQQRNALFSSSKETCAAR